MYNPSSPEEIRKKLRFRGRYDFCLAIPDPKESSNPDTRRRFYSSIETALEGIGNGKLFVPHRNSGRRSSEKLSEVLCGVVVPESKLVFCLYPVYSDMPGKMVQKAYSCNIPVLFLTPEGFPAKANHRDRDDSAEIKRVSNRLRHYEEILGKSELEIREMLHEEYLDGGEIYVPMLRGKYDVLEFDPKDLDRLTEDLRGYLLINYERFFGSELPEELAQELLSLRLLTRQSSSGEMRGKKKKR
ncbi:hypothetical protein GF386_02020 [Candidatus Pacearchaeota archaeon]|nr:hypothetical protein [Candidatus Pacearchaeota archaeon]MBD3282950.1 hypothetical protein [Candidatus Pacearchaeota archaeon]